MILVTGASGKTGQAVVAALARTGAPTRALVRHASQIEVLTDLGAHEAMAADMRLGLELRRAFENIRAVYHICPNVNPDEVEIGRGVIHAAREAGVPVVYAGFSLMIVGLFIVFYLNPWLETRRNKS